MYWAIRVHHEDLCKAMESERILCSVRKGENGEIVSEDSHNTHRFGTDLGSVNATFPKNTTISPKESNSHGFNRSMFKENCSDNWHLKDEFHVTLIYRGSQPWSGLLSPSEIHHLKWLEDQKEPISLKIHSLVYDKHCCALRVKISHEGASSLCRKPVPHITLALDSHTCPAYSNDMLKMLNERTNRFRSSRGRGRSHTQPASRPHVLVFKNAPVCEGYIVLSS